MSREEKLLIVSNVLNNTNALGKIADELGELWWNTDDVFFISLEELILDYLERMDRESRGK